MKRPTLIALGAASSIVLLGTLVARPPATKAAPKAAASPAPEATLIAPTGDPLAHWLLEQNGGSGAIALPLREVIRSATGKHVAAFEPANAADAAFLAQLSVVMDRVLPRMNRPESAAQIAARLAGSDEVAQRFEAELRAAVREIAGWSAGDPPGTSAKTPPPAQAGHGYPAVRIASAAAGKTYYLGVTLYPSGKRGAAGPALTFRPDQAACPIDGDGCCLLIGIERAPPSGDQTAFLNWDVTDVANLPVRLAVTFAGDGSEVYHPGAVLTDGRKGND